jgi:hypothetical protein
MTLASQLTTAFTRVGTEFKTAYGKIGDLTTLTTTAKSSAVAAINELEASISGAGATINDSAASTSSVYSSSKTQSVANAAALAIINDSAAASSTTYSSTKVAALVAGLIADGSVTSSTTYSSTKIASSILALINDAAADTTHVYSSSKTNAAISAAINALINSAPGTLDTLGEIAAQMASDESGAAAMTTAINNRVRYDASQSLTSPQMIQATTNIGAATVATVGDTTTDFATAFTAALT